jgi:hypothetical protein
METKRHLKRRHLVFYLKVFDTRTRQYIGHLSDITTEGVMVKSDQWLETGIEYHLKIELPTPVRNREIIEFRCRSVWCRKKPKSAYFSTGFQILEISSEDKEVIEYLINTYKIK